MNKYHFEESDLKQVEFSGLCSAKPIETGRIHGVMDIAAWFDVYLFSVQRTLYTHERAHPNGVVVVPVLRRMGKKVFLFSIDSGKSKTDIISEVNPLGLSFGFDEVLDLDDVMALKGRFPLIPAHRFLFICSDLNAEVPLSRTYNFSSLYVTGDSPKANSVPAMWTDYICEQI